MKIHKRDMKVSRLISEAINIEMELDEKILLFGEDVGKLGGVFASTIGLQKKFGDKRVRDMPISEMAFTGMGVGLSMMGYRPIIEIMFVDFIGVCFEQIIHSMSKIPFMSGGKVKIPMVIKTAAGCIGSAAQHSQCLWGTFAHFPGMHVVTPSNPYDYKGLLAASIQSDNPTIFIEHKSHMHKRVSNFILNQDVPEERYITEIGKAKIVKQGSDLTIVTLSAQVEQSLKVSNKLKTNNIDVEVIDLLSIVPMDIETICSSLSKTKRLLIIDEDYLSFGISGEIITRVIENLGIKNIKQIERLGNPDIPVPAAKSLEELTIPNHISIENKIIEMSKSF
ncbi:alpha-ketoacid dehydrogenase subunit beta [Alphaproteobacteria bacterium]|nr:alpha-ketoacid dehydrogenase subunit beta [Alphaproteobacteria bacterium]